ncbi:sensor histidine kinase [Saccharopolyspora sp. HNM0983]|uniref:histidine kinase n=1 Tax=Saccharopolyspora montiporae TaxID=2781240 RepID=A0A929BD94_9PSEU|nr:histidine kinase [Saccharopolyspora sp. HNM0983]MBE9375928.1 sensor histidine kinase [Saccharopolyspora sp. HNM0983]
MPVRRPEPLRRFGWDLLALGIPLLALLVAQDGWGFPLVAGLVATAGLLLRRRRARTALVLCLPALSGGLGWAASWVALYRLGRTRPGLLPLGGWAVPVVLAALVPVLVRESLGVRDVVLTAAFVLVATAAPLAVGALVALRAELAGSLRRLTTAVDRESMARAEAARAEERAFIAREIHDAVGHHVTLLAFEAAALGVSTQDARTAAAAERMRGLAQQALGEMRLTLGLAGGQVHRTGLDAVPALVHRARESGLRVELDDRVDGVDPPAAVQRAVYRVVQEGLTNAAKHAPGAPVRVDVRVREQWLEVSVVNDAAVHRPEGSAGAGSGLAGLCERVATAGGELTSSPSADGGFALHAVLPVQ